jgi:hypothetical protein
LRKPDAAPSYFVSLRTADHKIHTHWAAGLGSALERAGARVGDAVEIAQTGKVPVMARDKDGNERTFQRITWAVQIHERPTVPEKPKAPDRVQEAPKAPIKAPKAPVEDPERVYEQALAQCRGVEYQAAKAAVEALRLESRQHAEAIQAHLADKPWTPLGRGKWDRAGVALDATRRELDERERAAVQRVADPVAIERAAVAELRRQEPEVVAAAAVARKEREAREQERERKANAKEAAGRAFKLLAFNREKGAYGYNDRGDKWKSMPDELKKQIEDYNRLPKEKRPKELERIGRDPGVAKLLQEHREQARTQGRGGYGD